MRDSVRRGGWCVVWLVGWVGCASGPERMDSPAARRARELMSGGGRDGNLVLRCEPSDAEVYLDGVQQGVCTDFAGTPRGLRVGEGLHQIDVRHEGFWPYVTYYEPSNARATLTLRLRAVVPEESRTP
jgi:hypothetical protein